MLTSTDDPRLSELWRRKDGKAFLSPASLGAAEFAGKAQEGEDIRAWSCRGFIFGLLCVPCGLCERQRIFSLARFARGRRARRESARRPRYKTLLLPVIHFRSSLRTLWALRETKDFFSRPLREATENAEAAKNPETGIEMKQ